jgi:hypothetical protein
MSIGSKVRNSILDKTYIYTDYTFTDMSGVNSGPALGDILQKKASNLRGSRI